MMLFIAPAKFFDMLMARSTPPSISFPWRALQLVALCAAVLLAWPTSAGAQGFRPNSVPLPVELGYIDASDGNLHLEIPIYSSPQRGQVPYVARLVYDSHIWKQATVSGSASWQLAGFASPMGGWRLIMSGSPGTVSYKTQTLQCFYQFPPPGSYRNYNKYSQFAWTSPEGRAFSFPNFVTTTSNACHTGSSSFNDKASDGSGFQMHVTNTTSATIYAPDGTQVYPIVKDTNGNFYSTIIDTLGRTPVTVTTNCNSNPNQTCYNVLNAKGQRSTFVVTTTSIPVSTAFGTSGVTEFVGNIPVVQSITLPDMTTYQFNYDSGSTAGHYGVLTGTTLPTGGQLTYSHSNFTDSYDKHDLWVTSRTSGGGNWNYTPAVISTCAPTAVGCQQKLTATSPSGDDAAYTFTWNSGAWNTQQQFYNGSASAGTLLTTVTTDYDFANPPILPIRITTTLPVPGGNISRKTEFAHDTNNFGNITTKKDWKFYSGTPPAAWDRMTQYSYLVNSNGNMVNKKQVITVSNSAGSVVAQTTVNYDTGGLVAVTGVSQHDDTNFGTGNTARGNPTQIQRCTVLSACSANYVQTTATYDTTGQVRSVQDPNSNTTTFSYADSFFNDVGDGPSNPPQPYPVTPATNAYLTSVSPPLIPASTMRYYYGTGQLASSTDPNGQTIYSHFFDAFSRPTSAVLPNSGWSYAAYSAAETQLDAYTGITGAFATSGCTGCRQDEALLDNLGRVTTQKLMSDPEGMTTVTTNYDTTGRVLNISHPARTTASSTDGVETPSYDGLGRATKVTHTDSTFSQTLYGAAVSGAGAQLTQLCSSTTYGLGYPVLMVDEAGKKREVWTDGFGRTIEADEPDSSGSLTSNTCYKYDPLGNLLQIVHGSQTRTYAYDALSRVTSVTIPELANASGTPCSVTYTYDSDSNVKTQVAPAPNQTSCTTTVTITFSYDALNRLTGKTYSDGSPAVKYGYDNIAPTGCTPAPPALTITNPKGRRTSMCDSSGAASWSYDSMGRVLTEARTILGVTKNISYSYNLEGSIATVTYPSTKVVTYTVSNAQRLTAAKDVANNIQFATAVSYAPPGALNGMITGQISGFGGITESHTYNNSLEYTSTQVTSTAGTALNLTLNYNLTGGDNGTVTSVTNNADPLRTQSFTYDPLNRILSAKSSATSGVDCWGQNFGPDGVVADDAVANLTKINNGTQALPPCTLGSLNATVDPNNHFTADPAYAYDAVGNMTKDGSGTGYLYTFDAEGRLTLAAGPSGGPYCYVYDGLGLRVAKKSNVTTTCSSGTVTKLYWRGITGDALAESDSTGSTTNTAYVEYVFFAGRRVASRMSNGNSTEAIFYYFADQLGSTRTITTGSGKNPDGSNQTPGLLCYDADFTPYGQEISYTQPGHLQATACPPNYKFTGYERDAETGLDYAFARFYSSLLGRFLSTDPIGGTIGDLQSHNAYAYVGNDPLNSVDPLGMTDCPQGKTCGIYVDGMYIDLSPLFGRRYSGMFGWDPFDVLQIAFTPTSWRPNANCPGGDCANPWLPVYGNLSLLSLLGIGSGGGLLEKAKNALNYAADRNRCAAKNAGSAASALGISKNNEMGQSLLGNDFSSISQFLTGPNRGRAAGDLVMSNPTPVNAIGIGIKGGLDWISTSGKGIVLAQNGAGTYFGVGSTATTLGAKAGGKVASKALAVLSAIKLVADGFNYFSSLVACSSDPLKN